VYSLRVAAFLPQPLLLIELVSAFEELKPFLECGGLFRRFHFFSSVVSFRKRLRVQTGWKLFSTLNVRLVFVCPVGVHSGQERKKNKERRIDRRTPKCVPNEK
jgi:hypothetical protein